MSLLQVVERRDGEKPEIETVPISEGAPYTEAASNGRDVARWGSHDLVVLASELVDKGFHATTATVTDAYAPSAEQDEETEHFAADLLEAVNSGRAKAEQFLDEDPSDFLILAVTMANRALGSFRIAQNGQVRVLGQAASEHVDEFTNLLRQAILAEN